VHKEIEKFRVVANGMRWHKMLRKVVEAINLAEGACSKG
jgi:hypothetical protein